MGGQALAYILRDEATRLDQLRRAQKETVGLNRGTAIPTRVDDKPTLASQGVLS
jgi:hypothetical protein